MSNTVTDWQDETPAPSTATEPTDWQDESSSASPVAEGQRVNDVGNIVIVPKAGESFSDTMKRAAAQGKRTTPEQINREVQTMPKKVATVLAAAPVIGATGAALTTNAVAGAPPAAVELLEAAAKAHPLIAAIVEKGLTGLGIGGGYAAVKKLLQ